MKYIRTKDGVYEVDFVDISTYYHTTGWNIVEKDQIIAQADTIEELCDGFYATENSCWEKDYYLFGNKDFKDFKDFTKDFPNGFARGFIATNKGLIYVAKMDSEGNLILL